MIGGESLLEAARRLVYKAGGILVIKAGRRLLEVTDTSCLVTLPPPAENAAGLQPARLTARALASRQSKDEEKCLITLPSALAPVFTYIMTSSSARNEVVNTTRPELPRRLKLLLHHLKSEIFERTASIAQSISR